MQPKGQSYIGRCGKSDNRHQEDLPKFGYKSDMKCKSQIWFLCNPGKTEDVGQEGKPTDGF